ncbi:MAG: DALR anticodon-binding domain-containing protein, partial [Henriciella sp.]
GSVKIVEPSERKLVLALDGFSLALSLAREKRMPHYLCEHIYTVAQSFSAFYGALPIVRESDTDIRAARLALCEAVLLQLETGLELLGITAPDRM